MVATSGITTFYIVLQPRFLTLWSYQDNNNVGARVLYQLVRQMVLLAPVICPSLFPALYHVIFHFCPKEGQVYFFTS